MDYKMLIAKTHERVLNANDKVDFFNSVMDHPANKKQLKMFEEELDYFETIEKMLKAKSKNPALNEFLRVAIKEEWIRVEIQVIVIDMLKEKDEAYKKKLNRWLELLKTDGINSKLMVANDIQNIIKELTTK